MPSAMVTANHLTGEDHDPTYRAIGRRGSDGAQLGLGLAAIGRPAYITLGRHADLPTNRSPAALESRAHELLDEATALGIRYVDAARSYGLAEQFLGHWLRGRETPPFVASKWGYEYTAGWRSDAIHQEIKDHSLSTFERQLAETTDLLGPWLRLYQVHSLTADSPLWQDPALQNRLAALRVTGVEVGFSTSGAAQGDAVRRGLELTVDGVALFSSVQTTWNLLEPSAGDALTEAHAAGLRVVIKEALANGRLTDRNATRDSRLEQAARQYDVGVDAIALAAALAQPWCDVVLCGAVTVTQLQSNATALTLVGAVDTANLVTPEPPQEYWAARSRLRWT
jgi:aryl-alcohol dehydrogenase-like predicted oxidoreductase